eukprot:CAMPEP_0172493624 /NCGR_PEP_ID=MMETSP1066-20121228/25031_1 /TAXON_ID=671091 /ORGANISM="Coscinodiscus wailesii, Strain CCMP2513" /LENGTH=306 /DNA_ID=CAMNT_0013263847 /DNA_START=32 /DNA_END=952 /DNA_ORIENTATION=+
MSLQNSETRATVEFPANLCGKNQTATPENISLYDAAQKGDVTSLKAALAAGANPDYFKKSEEGTPAPLHAAVLTSSSSSNSSIRAKDDKSTAAIACTKTILRNGADVDATLISNRNTPLHLAASIGAADVCDVLLAAGASTDASNGFGNTPLYTATRHGFLGIVRSLLLAEKERGGADVVNAVNHRGSTALHLCSFLASTTKEGEGGSDGASDDVFLEIARCLLENGVNVDSVDVNGYSALHIASERGCLNMVKLLVDNNANLKLKTNVNSRGRPGRTSAEMATFWGNPEVHDFLVEIEKGNLADI